MLFIGKPKGKSRMISNLPQVKIHDQLEPALSRKLASTLMALAPAADME